MKFPNRSHPHITSRRARAAEARQDRRRRPSRRARAARPPPPRRDPARAPPRWAARPPAGHRSSDAPRYRRPGRSDRPSARRPAPRSTLASPISSASHRGEDAAPVREQRLADRGAGSTPAGSSTTRGSPPCASTIRSEPLERRRPTRSRRPPARAPPRDRPRSCSSSARAANSSASSRRRPPRLPREHGDRLRDVQRVADRVPERLRHVGHGGAGRPAPAGGEREASLRQRPRVLRGLHERPGARLHVEEDQVRLDRELLGHHAGGDQRDRRDRRRRVAQGVEGAVGGHEVRRLRRDRASHLLRPAAGSPPGERSVRRPGIDSSLSSVPPVCPSPRPESFATRESERRGERGEHQRDPVRDPSGRVLVHGRSERPCGRRPPENRSVSPDPPSPS